MVVGVLTSIDVKVAHPDIVKNDRRIKVLLPNFITGGIKCGQICRLIFDNLYSPKVIVNQSEL